MSAKTAFYVYAFYVICSTILMIMSILYIPSFVQWMVERAQ